MPCAPHRLYRMGTAIAGVLLAATSVSDQRKVAEPYFAGARLLDLIYCTADTSDGMLKSLKTDKDIKQI